MQSKMCEGITHPSLYVEEYDAIIHKQVFSLLNPIECLDILNSKSKANLMIEVGTRHSHQILL